jgi:uroporphyrin-III C-methyltransferase
MSRRDAKRIGVGAQRAAHGELASLLVREASKGQRVVYLDAGDPFAGRGMEIAALEALAIPFDLVPGVSTPSAAVVTPDARAA